MNQSLAYHQLSDRAQSLLRVLVDRYIRDGQPVGSRTLSRATELDLSPATIRNVMSDLEEQGLIFSPHTSAGRIPTALGYRLFVDSLLQVKPPSELEQHRLREQLRRDDVSSDPKHLTEQASNILSELTHFAGVVMLPFRQTRRLMHVEFLPIAEKKLLVILVLDQHEVQNRIIHVNRDYSASELEQAANYLNQAFHGKDIQAVKQQLLQDMQEARAHIDEMMQAAIEIAGKTFSESETTSNQQDVVISGQTNLMVLMTYLIWISYVNYLLPLTKKETFCTCSIKP